MTPEPSAPRSTPKPSRISAVQANVERVRVARVADVPEDRRQRDLLAEHEQDHRDHRAREPADQPLEHERSAHEPVRRADELHHLDLAPTREDRKPDRVRDQQRSKRRAGRSPRAGTRSRSRAPRAGSASPSSCRTFTFSTPTPAPVGILPAISATSSPCFGVISNASGSGLPGQLPRELGALLLHDLQRLGLRDELRRT